MPGDDNQLLLQVQADTSRAVSELSGLMSVLGQIHGQLQNILNVQVQANSGFTQLTKTVDDASESFGGFGQVMKGFSETFRLMPGWLQEAIGAITAVRFAVRELEVPFQALSDLTLEQAERFASFATQVHNASLQLGVSQEFIEAFRIRLTLIGQDADTGSFAMRIFSRSVEAAAEGSGKASELFNRLGVQVTDSGGRLKPTEELLFETAQALNGMQDGAAKVALTLQLFGRQGSLLLPVLAQMAGGSEAFVGQLKAMGVILDGQLLEAGHRWHEEWATIGVLMDAQRHIWGAFLAEALEPLVVALGSGLKAVVPVLQSFHAEIVVVAKVLESLAVGLGVFIASEAVVKGIALISAALTGLGVELGALEISLAIFDALIGNWPALLGAAAAGATGLYLALHQSAQGMAETRAQLESLKASGALSEQEFQRLSAVLDSLPVQSQPATESMSTMEQAAAGLGRAVETLYQWLVAVDETTGQMPEHLLKAAHALSDAVATTLRIKPEALLRDMLPPDIAAQLADATVQQLDKVLKAYQATDKAAGELAAGEAERTKGKIAGIDARLEAEKTANAKELEMQRDALIAREQGDVSSLNKGGKAYNDYEAAKAEARAKDLAAEKTAQNEREKLSFDEGQAIAKTAIDAREKATIATLDIAQQGVKQLAAVHQISAAQELEQLHALENQKLDARVKALQDWLAVAVLEPSQIAAINEQIAQLNRQRTIGDAEEVTKRIEAMEKERAAQQKLSDDVQAYYAKAFGTETQNKLAELAKAHDKLVEEIKKSGHLEYLAEVDAAYAQMVADAKGSVIDLGKVFTQASDDAFNAVINGTRKGSDALQAFTQSIGKQFAKGFEEALIKKIGFDQKFNINMTETLPGMAAEGGSGIVKNISAAFDLLSGGPGVGRGATVSGGLASWTGGPPTYTTATSATALTQQESALLFPRGQSASTGGQDFSAQGQQVGSSGAAAASGSAAVAGYAALIAAGIQGAINAGEGLSNAYDTKNVFQGFHYISPAERQRIAYEQFGEGFLGAFGFKSAALANIVNAIEPGQATSSLFGGGSTTGGKLAMAFSNPIDLLASLIIGPGPTLEDQFGKSLDKAFAKANIPQAVSFKDSVYDRPLATIAAQKDAGKPEFQKILQGNPASEVLRDPLAGLGQVLQGGNAQYGLMWANTMVNNFRALGLSIDQSRMYLSRFLTSIGATLPNVLDEANKQLLTSKITQDQYNASVADTVKIFASDLPQGVDAGALALQYMEKVGDKSIVNVDELAAAVQTLTTGLNNLASSAITASIKALATALSLTPEQQTALTLQEQAAERQYALSQATHESNIKTLGLQIEQARLFGDTVTEAQLQMQRASEEYAREAEQAAEKQRLADKAAADALASPQGSMRAAIQQGVRDAILSGVVDALVKQGVIQVALAPMFLALKALSTTLSDPNATKAQVDAAFAAFDTALTTAGPNISTALGTINRIISSPGLTTIFSTVNNLGLPKLAAGGIVSAPTLALLGERGPEAVVPLSRGNALAPTVQYVFTGNYILDEASANRLARLVSNVQMRDIKRNALLS
jgi:hypothetical protein